MQVDVIVMTEKNVQSIMDWQLRCDRKGELRAVYADGSDQAVEKAWKDLALKIYRRALRGKNAPLEIFLYLRDGLHNSIYDYGILGEIVADARHYVVGGKLYVVWDKLPEQAFVQIFSEESNQILLAKCFCAFLHSGVTDSIEIARGEKPHRECTFDAEKKILRGCAVISEKRQQTLNAVMHKDGWGYVLRNEAWLLETLLNELMREAGLSSFSPNHVIIFDAVPNYRFGGPKALLDKFRGINPGGKGMVATTPEGYSRHLSQECNNVTPPLKIVTFNGIFEVMYALLQLNK
ncbi:MAG: hypothetical protein QOH25_1551 [Acidobacteriota bacterium]|jgi:hypothetical protein|nr:hypothetical protein [Acidobacteriota bacterium]